MKLEGQDIILNGGSIAKCSGPAITLTTYYCDG